MKDKEIHKMRQKSINRMMEEILYSPENEFVHDLLFFKSEIIFKLAVERYGKKCGTAKRGKIKLAEENVLCQIGAKEERLK